MSYLHAAKQATFQYHNKHLYKLDPPNPPKSLSMQKHGEIIYETLQEITLEEFERSGVELPYFNILDLYSIVSVRLYNEKKSVELFFDKSKIPYRLKISKKDMTDLYEIAKKDAIIEITQKPCSGNESCPTAIVVPGKIFSDI